MFMSDTYRRLRSEAAHDARHLIKAYDIFPQLGSLFADDVTYNVSRNSIPRDGYRTPLDCFVQLFVEVFKTIFLRCL